MVEEVVRPDLNTLYLANFASSVIYIPECIITYPMDFCSAMHRTRGSYNSREYHQQHSPASNVLSLDIMPPPPPVPHPPPSPSTPPRRPSRFAPYTQALTALSQRTRTPLPSLVVSFAVLHELTAIVPLAGFFFGARALGVGESVVNVIANSGQGSADGPSGWMREKGREWVDEGERWAERVGRRYGVFGYEKRDRSRAVAVGDGDNNQIELRRQPGEMSTKVAGDVANAVVAYALTKVRPELLL